MADEQWFKASPIDGSFWGGGGVKPLDEIRLLEISVQSRLKIRSNPVFREAGPLRMPTADKRTPEWCGEQDVKRRRRQRN